MSETFITYDNDFQGIEMDTSSSVYADLDYFAGTPIKELNDQDNLLIFPQCLGDFGDDIGDNVICDFRKVRDKRFLTTGNVLGFVGRKDTQLRIASRFDKESSGDYFLLYMLEKVFAINLFDLKFGHNPEAVFDFLIYLFPYYLNRAMRQGLYKEYQTHHFNDSHVRGTIDVARHIKENYPFHGTLAYSVREHAFDNDLTELIRHTIEYIYSRPAGNVILQRDRETADNVSSIVQATPAYTRNSRGSIINKNSRPKVHPYYSEYAPLQQLCLQILRGESIRYGSDSNQIYGLLFDGAWLWEEYLATLLKPMGYRHPENKRSKGAIKLFDSGGTRYPDFYNPELQIVLDAKYKRSDNKSSVSQLDRDDVHQVVTYMHVLKYNTGGFLLPATESVTIQSQDLRGYGGQMAAYGLIIPQKTISYKEFSTLISIAETNFIQQIHSIKI